MNPMAAGQDMLQACAAGCDCRDRHVSLTIVQISIETYYARVKTCLLLRAFLGSSRTEGLHEMGVLVWHEP